MSIFIVVKSFILLLIFFFFFQAEDGIRDGHVTGVQTCALPICLPKSEFSRLAKPIDPRATSGPILMRVPKFDGPPRSEERRVGKECRSRWATDDQKKKEEEKVMTQLIYTRNCDEHISVNATSLI